MKKWLAGLLSVVLMFSLVGCSEEKDGSNEDTDTFKITPLSGECGDDVKFTLTADGTLTISGTGKMDGFYGKDDVIPWEEQKSQITTVIIEYGVASIGVGAFYECSALEEVTIPASMQKINDNAFGKCSSLKTINLPKEMDGELDIMHYAFSECTSLESIELPIGVSCVFEYAFNDCTSLKYVALPDTPTQQIHNVVKKNAFELCQSLEEIRIPSSWRIEDSAFNDCTNIIIYGTKGSIAQTYAEENGIAFVIE